MKLNKLLNFIKNSLKSILWQIKVKNHSWLTVFGVLAGKIHFQRTKKSYQLAKVKIATIIWNYLKKQQIMSIQRIGITKDKAPWVSTFQIKRLCLRSWEPVLKFKILKIYGLIVRMKHKMKNHLLWNLKRKIKEIKEEWKK